MSPDDVRNNSVHVAPGGAENTRWDRQLCTVSQGKLSPIFWMVVFCVNCVQVEGSERLDVEAPICASLWRLPCLCGDDTHAVVTRGARAAH